MIQINGVDLELDVFDADVAEKYEHAMEHVLQESNSCKGLKGSESIRKQCNAVFYCFDSIFGEGTHEKIFGNKVNLIQCLDAISELDKEFKSQHKDIQTRINKYSPNRAQRRSKK